MALVSGLGMAACVHPAQPDPRAEPSSDGPAQQQHHANRDDDPRATRRSFTLAPGEFVDLNVNVEADASIGVAYCGASKTTSWKVIAFAPNGEMLVFDRGRGSAGKVVFTAPAVGHYSVRWINGGATTSTLEAAVDIGPGATLHSWVQSWVPRDEPERPTEREPACELEPPPLPECVRREPATVTTSCEALPSYQHRLTLDWPASRRADLLALLRADEGAIVVEQRGCELILKPECRGQQRYEFNAFVASESRQELSTPEELWSNLPELADAEPRPVIVEELRRGRFTLGPWASDRPPPWTPWSPAELELQGDCAGASHVLIDVEVGAGRLLESDAEDPALVDVGRMRGCRQRRHEIEALARASCLEPLQVSLLPLADSAPLSEPCLAPSRWNHLHCVDPIVHPPALCLDPYHPTCQPWGDPLAFELAPERIDEPRVRALLSNGACGQYQGRLELVIDGPSGQVTEICGAGPSFRAAAERAVELRLPSSRAPAQRLMVECDRD
jgi:hypothetical protein